MLKPIPFWPVFLFVLLIPLVCAIASPLPLALLLPLTGLLGFPAARLMTGAWPKADWPLYIWIMLFAGLGALSVHWSVAPDESMERSIKIGALLLLSLPVIDLARACPEHAFRPFRVWVPALTLLIGLASLSELYFDFPIYRLAEGIPREEPIWGAILNKNVSMFILLLPISLLLCKRTGFHVLAIALLLTALILAAITQSQASQMALIMIPFAWALTFVLPGTGIPIAFGLTAMVLLLMPWISPLAFSLFAEQLSEPGTIAQQASASMRLENWDFIARKIMENPWTGFGMDATRSIPSFETRQLYFKGDHIMHPHNIALQIWIEFGLIGMTLALAFLGFLFARLQALPRPQRRLPFIMFCATMTFLMISWSVWSGWLLALLVYLAALMILAAKTNSVPATS